MFSNRFAGWPIRLLPIFVFSTGIVLSLADPKSAAERAPFAFRSANGAAQLEREALFDSLLEKRNLEEWMRRMTTRPHHAGSPKARENAHFIADLFRSWGYETRIEVFHVLFPTPKTRELELLRPHQATLPLSEEIVATDSAASALRAEALPPYNAYSADGDVTGPLVYVNRGLPEDYEMLERFGIDVRGKIVLARYGGSWRGIKPKVAEEKGAIGCIIFHDPIDDGYSQGAAYPDGAFKHETAVQRGSVLDLPVRPGDPLTPFSGATQDAERLARSKAETVMRIPVLPVSIAAAEKLIGSLEGFVAPDHWRGTLPVTYRLGGTEGTVARLTVSFSWDIVPSFNVIARMPGREFPDEWLLRGNHHDSWAIGARDPISGLVPLLEQARGFAALRDATGWRPRRTLVFCAWDAEEPGLLGSTEWCEQHAEELREKAVVYLNSDNNARGFLGIGGSHALETFAGQVAREVKDPRTGSNVSDRLRASWLVNGSSQQQRLARARRDLYLNPLGSGSDYTPFLQHLGIASFDVRFRGEGQGGEYHTSFDTFDHFTRYIDPGFDYSLALVQVCGRLMMRLADADVLPFDFRAASRTFSGYLDEVIRLCDELRQDTEQTNQLITDDQFKLASDPTLPFVLPKRQDPVPFLNFAPLQNASEKLSRAANDYHRAFGKFVDGKRSFSSSELRELNGLLLRSERALLNPEGLPRRPWYRHQIYAPGFYTGYGVKTMPGVREAIEERNWAEAEVQITALAGALDRYTSVILRACSVIDDEKETATRE